MHNKKVSRNTILSGYQPVIFPNRYWIQGPNKKWSSIEPTAAIREERRLQAAWFEMRVAETRAATKGVILTD